jgi:microcystin-dependent protein
MASPMLGQISLFPYDFAPSGWKFCDGSKLPTSENIDLYNLLDCDYGDDFALPDLRDMAPTNCHYCIKVTGDYPIGSYPGAAGETLLTSHSFTPPNMMECAGQKVPKGKHSALETYMGTRFGGDATTFKMPDLRTKNPTGLHYVMTVDGPSPDTRGIRDTFLGELLLVPFELSRADHLKLCDGTELYAQLMRDLYALLGNRFGGVQPKFALPDLRGAAPSQFNYYLNLQGDVPPRG